MKFQTTDKIVLKEFEYRVERKYRNYTFIFYLYIAGLSMLFLTLTFMYVMYRMQYRLPAVHLIPFFHWNSLLLLLSGCMVYLLHHFYSSNNYTQYKTCLLIFGGLGILFISSQIAALLKQMIQANGITYYSAYYLFLLGGIQLLQVVCGYVFFVFFSVRAWKRLNNYALSLVYFTDPIERLQLNLFAKFWYFMVFSWLFIVLFFMAFRF